MALPLPLTDLEGAAVSRYRYRIPRQHIPGAVDCWLVLPDGAPVQLRFSEVRGLQDLALCGAALAALAESAASPFAKGLPAQPIFPASQPGRIFRWDGARDHRGIPVPRGEVVASGVKLVEPGEPAPPVAGLAAPIPWEQAVQLLETTRILGIEGYAEGDQPVVEIRAGSPRGEYAIRGVGVALLEDAGYPGDRGLVGLQRTDRVLGGFRIELMPAKQKGGTAPLALEAADIRVQKVVKPEPG
ncbi:MAG TPA: hypothetical protein VEI97_18960 [bacterium]|nr:hypothetical protein [bacterium]